MSKIIFDDKSSIECNKSDNPGKIVITIAAVDQTDKLKRINNSCELTVEEFQQLIAGIL